MPTCKDSECGEYFDIVDATATFETEVTEPDEYFPGSSPEFGLETKIELACPSCGEVFETLSGSAGGIEIDVGAA